MRTNTFIKALAFAMLLATACNKSEIANEENTEKKGFALPVTVNVTREGDDATKATYNETSKKLEFSAGDKLLVRGNDNSDGGAGMFAGLLDYDASEGKFSGTIYTKNSYSGTADELFTAANSNWVGATLFPNGYETYAFLSLSGSGYSTSYSMSYNKAIAATKAAAIEQLSLESAKEYSSGFALSPENAIFNFTITGLTDGEKAVTLKDGTRTMFTGSVTPSSGTAAFVLGAMIKNHSDFPVNLKNVTLTIGGTDIDITSTSKNLEAGKIYNITRNAISGALIGQFSVSSTKKVFFSKGNLQATYNGTGWTWKFADTQWSYIGKATGNTKVTATSPFISENATVDLFGWVGASSTWDGVNQYGITSSKATNETDGYGNVATETMKHDWGELMGAGWRTLTGGDSGEWAYLLNTRTVNGGTGKGKSYTTGQSVNGVMGVVLYPDNYTGSEYAGSDWNTFESAGCVFLPAAGSRNGASVSDVGIYGYYWSSTPNASGVGDAYPLSFSSSGVYPTYYYDRYYGLSVRLVQNQ